jgi:hypothetical protein
VELDLTQHCDHDRGFKRLIEACAAEEVPRVNHEIDQSEAQERGRRDVAAAMGDEPLGWYGGEGHCLPSCRLNHRGERIVSELITTQLGPSRVAVNACEEERREAVPDHNVLNQLAHRDLRWRRPIP